MLCEVVIRYDDGTQDTFLAKEAPEVPQGIKTRTSGMVEFPYTTPSGQQVSNYVRATKKVGVVVNEIQEPPM